MNKTSKKVLLGAFALTSALALAACGNNKQAESKFKDLVVDSQPFSGDFFNADFSNSAYDADVIYLSNSTATFETTFDGKVVVNEGIVAKDGFTKAKDADGNTVATFKLRKDLKWSDGKPVTAHDYMFAVLFTNSPEWGELGANVSLDPAYIGGQDYVEGKTKNLKAFKLIDDYSFSVTVSKDALPYFYENIYYSIGAFPLHELGQGGKVVSSDEGISFEGDMKKVAENAKKTQVDSKKPTVTYGKYLIDKSGETEVVLKKNPNYVGNYEGVKPTVETITIKTNKNSELDVERLKAGEVDLVLGVIAAEKISSVKGNDKFGQNRYERNGYGYLGMANDFGPTKDVNVRRAIGHLTNRNGLITSFLGGNGVAVNGEYALAHWMSKEKSNEVAALNAYAYDVKLANDELNKSSYRFEADGTTPFDVSKASETYLRYNSNKEPLEIKHLGTDNNPITTFLQTNFQQDGPKVGLKYSVETTDFPNLQNAMKLTAAGSPEQKYHLYNLATSFTGATFDPYMTSYHSRNLGQSTRNAYRVKDDVLDNTSEAMRKVDPANLKEYADLWLKYQTRFNEILPVLPLYANIYTDIYSAEKVAELKSGSIQRWSQKIEYTRLK